MNNTINEESINRVLNRKGTEEEIDLVFQWFETDQGQEYLYKKMDKELSEKKITTSNLEDEDIPSDRIYQNIRKSIRKKKNLRFARYAATLLLPLLFLGWGLMKVDSHLNLFGEIEYVDIYVPKGKQIQVAFQDGSIAYLNSDSKLRYPKQFGLLNRTVYLDGEAYFVIEKNPTRPFIVEMDSVAVNVFGTSFNVEGYSEDRTISVILDEGKVNLTPYSLDKEYAMKPGERLEYDKFSRSCVISDNNNITSPSLWIDDIVYLNDEPLEEVLKILDRKYDVRFVVEDQATLDYKYTIMIAKNSSLNKVILDLERIAPVRFDKNGNLIRVIINKK